VLPACQHPGQDALVLQTNLSWFVSWKTLLQRAQQ
jgi:hypothetical protein